LAFLSLLLFGSFFEHCLSFFMKARWMSGQWEEKNVCTYKYICVPCLGRRGLEVSSPHATKETGVMGRENPAWVLGDSFTKIHMHTFVHMYFSASSIFKDKPYFRTSKTLF
jgi:hypothetical protein